MQKLRIFLADDHPIVRQGLRGLIDSQEDMEVIGEAGDGAATVHQVLDLNPDVAVVDISLPELSGTDATLQICQRDPTRRVVILTAHEEVGFMQVLLRAGARGYVLKRTAAEDLVRAIRVVAGGEMYIDASVSSRLVTPLAVEPKPAPIQPSVALSEREDEVLRLIAQGHGIKEIASKLEVGVRTIETYKARAMEKLGLKTRVNIIRYALEQGWLKE